MHVLGQITDFGTRINSTKVKKLTSGMDEEGHGDGRHQLLGDLLTITYQDQ